MANKDPIVKNILKDIKSLRANLLKSNKKYATNGKALLIFNANQVKNAFPSNYSQIENQIYC